MGSGLVVNLIIGYYYGAAELGVFNQILGFYLIITTFISFGINNAIIQKISTKEEESHGKIFSSSLFLTTISAIFFTGTTLLLCFLLPGIFSSPELAYGLSIASLSFIFFNWNKNFMAYCTGTRNQKLFANSRSIRWIIILMVIFSVSFLQLDVNYVYWSFLLAEISLSMMFLWKFQFLFTKAFTKSDLSSNLNFGLKSFVAEIFSILNDKMDLVILGYVLTATDIGIYSFLIFFAKSIYVFPGILQQNINPLIGKHWVQGTMDELTSVFKGIRKTNTLVILAQFVVVTAIYYLITANFQPEFEGTTIYLIIAMVGTICFGLISWGGSFLVMINKLDENIKRTGLILIFSIVSLILLPYLFGLYGAVMAIVFNGIFSLYILNSFVRRVSGIRLL